MTDWWEDDVRMWQIMLKGDMYSVHTEHSAKLYIPSTLNIDLNTVANTIDCVCSKMLNHIVNHGLFLSLFKLIPCPIQNYRVTRWVNFNFRLFITFIWIFIFNHELLSLDSNVRAKLTIMLKIKKFSKSFFSHIGNIK